MDHSQARIKPFRQVPTQIRACDWSMLYAFAFARNTLTHLVIELHRKELRRTCPAPRARTQNVAGIYTVQGWSALLRSCFMYPKWRSTRAKVTISVRAINVAETDSPTSRTCHNWFRNYGFLGQRSASARAWAAARTASNMAKAAVFSLFGGTSISIAGPAPSSAFIAARGCGAGRHVRVTCPVECPHACAPPRDPAPPPPFLCRGMTLVMRHPRSSSARGVASTQITAQRRRGDRPTAARLWHSSARGQVARHQTRVEPLQAHPTVMISLARKCAPVHYRQFVETRGVNRSPISPRVSGPLCYFYGTCSRFFNCWTTKDLQGA